jgi:hypothetical protein
LGRVNCGGEVYLPAAPSDAVMVWPSKIDTRELPDELAESTVGCGDGFARQTGRIGRSRYG